MAVLLMGSGEVYLFLLTLYLLWKPKLEFSSSLDYTRGSYSPPIFRSYAFPNFAGES